MDPLDLRILVISFYFPPFNKVGGRRWAKHCKYFEKSNINFNVLSGQFDGTSPWDKDIEAYNKKITRVDLTRKNFPYHLKHLPGNFLQKIIWKLSLISWESKKKRLQGNYADVSVGNEEKFYIAAKKIITERAIKTVILSTGPFSYSSIFLKLKRDFPEVKLVIDYRDFWEDGFTGLTEKQIAQEVIIQKKVIDTVDLVLVPNAEMRDYYANKFRKHTYVLPHCIDEDDIQESIKKINIPGEINFIYGGAFYSNIHENISTIKKMLDQMSLTHKVKADFYVSIKGYEKELQHKSIQRKDFIDANLYFEKVANTDYVILILPPNRVNAMSSKFFELVAMRKPILYFGNSGAVSEFLIDNQLGFHISGHNMNEQVQRIIQNFNEPKVPDLKYDITTHTFKYQTQLLIQKLSKDLALEGQEK